MSMIGDYKSYKKFAPLYPQWKIQRDTAEAKRIQYLKENPSEINPEDIKKSKALLRAIDVMDEYSQKRSEDMETATEAAITYGLEIAMILGCAMGAFVGKIKPIKKLIGKFIKSTKKEELYPIITGTIGGVILSSIVALPLFALGAKAEINASKKGRFEAMRTELKDPKTFAVLNEEQENTVQEILALSPKHKKKPLSGFTDYWKSIKNGIYNSKEYRLQKAQYEQQLEEDKHYHNAELTIEEIENAKKDEQLLTKIVEKIDIASQDYAENIELATGSLLAGVFSLGTLFNLLYEKAATKLKWKFSIIPSVLSFVATIGTSIYAAQIQKEASRVGRFVAKRDFLEHPEMLTYVSEEKTNGIVDVKINQQKKPGFIKFLFNIWKNDREYKKWKKTEGEKEKNLSKALESIELSEQQIKEAKRLQHNTFKTFNKIDENSQKYAENIEALGQGIQQPILILCSLLGAAIGSKYLIKASKFNSTKDMSNIIKYMSICIASALPGIGIDAYITKEQKKASRVADMLAINELSDYRNYVDYSRLKTQHQ